MLLKYDSMKRVRDSAKSIPLIRFRKSPVPESETQSKSCSKSSHNDSYPNPFGWAVFGHGILTKDTMELPNTSVFANDDDLPAIPTPCSTPCSSDLFEGRLQSRIWTSYESHKSFGDRWYLVCAGYVPMQS